MRSRWNCLVVGSCNVFGLALLVLSATGGGSAVRAEDPATSPGSVLEKIAAGIEQRVADLQASVAALADSVTARRIAAQELCVGDGSGAQTCITKAQLDALLRVQTGQAPAAIEPDQTEQTATVDKSVVPLALVVPPPETPPVTEPSGVPLALPPAQAGEGRGGEAAAAMPEAAAAPEVAAAREADAAPAVPAAAAEAASVPEVAAAGEVEDVPKTAAAIPSATQPTTASSEAGAPLVVEAIVPSQPSEPADSIIAASAKPQSIITPERAVEAEDPAQHGSMETTSPPEVKTAPAEPASVSQRAE
jgi:hypothetical protein